MGAGQHTYPSVRSFEDCDFCKHDKSDPIHIEVRFSNPLNVYPHNVHGFCLTFDGNDANYTAVDWQGNTLTYAPSGREVKVSNQMKGEVTTMYLPLDRQAYQQIRPSQWTVYGKLLKHISSQIANTIKEQFKGDVENSFEQGIYTYVQVAESRLKHFVEEQTGLNLRLKLSIIDPTMILKDLRPRISDITDFEVDAEDEGAGVQSAIAVAIARTYAEIVQQPLIMAIEEPELYLHPHGCRHFYRILKDLAEQQVQIIYATHERSFVDIADFESIYLVKKEAGETKVYKGESGISNVDIVKAVSRFDEEINEVFFADKVILVEGPSDKIACKLALDKLGVEFDKYNVSVIECGGNTGIKPMAEILNGFEIDTLALVDEDPSNQVTQTTISGIGQILGSEKVFLQSPHLEAMFGETEKLTKVKSLRVLPTWFDSNEVPQVYEEVKNALELSISA